VPLGVPLLGEALKDRKHKGSGLAGAGLGAREQVMPCQDLRDGLCLNRRWAPVALGADCAQQVGAKAE
jgi:hypothetical protein